MACAYNVTWQAAASLVMCQDPFALAIAENGVEPGPERVSHFNSFGKHTVTAAAANPTGNPTAFDRSCYRAVEPQFS